MPTSTANQHMGGNTPSELYFIMTNPAPGNGFSDYNTAAGTVSNCTQYLTLSGIKVFNHITRYVCWNCISWLGYITLL